MSSSIYSDWNFQRRWKHYNHEPDTQQDIPLHLPTSILSFWHSSKCAIYLKIKQFNLCDGWQNAVRQNNLICLRAGVQSEFPAWNVFSRQCYTDAWQHKASYWYDQSVCHN